MVKTAADHKENCIMSKSVMLQFTCMFVLILDLLIYGFLPTKFQENHFPKYVANKHDVTVLTPKF